MRPIPTKLYDRWQTANLVGIAQHILIVRVRPGHMKHNYQTANRIDTGDPIIPPTIWEGSHNGANAWKGVWIPDGAWVTLPNIQSANWSRSFTDKGTSSLTVTLDNIAFRDETGAAGLYHAIKRGWFSPTRGISVAGRTDLWTDSGWGDILNGGWQIELWEGYGVPNTAETTPLPVADPDTHSCAPTSPAITRTWTGIIEDCELESHPDHATITARDFGVYLTDQRFILWNKAAEISSPVTFAHTPSGTPANMKHWVFTGDASDVVRMILIWAGFPEWHVENFGWRLFNPMQFGEDAFFMDAIDQMLDQGNFVFYLAAPTDDDRSIGVPHFEKQKALDAPPGSWVEVTDQDMLEAATMKWDLSDLPSEIRYQGALRPQTGTATLRRYFARYNPPWGLGHYSVLGTGVETTSFLFGPALDRVAGMRRYFTETLGAGSTAGLNSNIECLYAALLAALQYGIGMVTGQFQTAGLPAWDLNMQESVIDEGAGINSRMWIASIDSQHSLGPNGKWTTTIGGSYIDTEDINLVKADYDVIYAMLLTERA